MELTKEALKLEEEVKKSFNELGTFTIEQERLMNQVNLLKNVNLGSYNHSLRCGVLGKNVALYTIDLQPPVLFYAGLLHDVGLVMGKEDHEIAGHYINRGQFDFSSLITAYHRGFNSGIHDDRGFSEETIACAKYYSLIFRVIDHFDELTHPVLAKGVSEHIVIPGTQIRDELISRNETQKYLINNLYKTGIFQ